MSLSLKSKQKGIPQELNTKVAHLFGLSTGAGEIAVVFLMLILAFLTMVILAQLGHASETKHNFMQAGMYFIVGRMGAGKTYLMTWAAFHAHKRKLEIFTNVSSLQYKSGLSVNGNPPGMLRNWEDVMALQALAKELKSTQWRPIVVLLDEVHLWWRSYEWEVDSDLEEFFSYLRKIGILLLGTTQDWAFMSKRLRRLAYGVWEGKPWVHGHKYSLYTPGGFEMFSRGRPKNEGQLYLIRRKKIMKTYDTREIVKSVVAPERKVGGTRKPGQGTNGVAKHDIEVIHLKEDAVKHSEIGANGGE